jgi:protoheme IX farnesyltransferase
MLPVVRGESATYQQITVYAVLLLLSSLGLVIIHSMGIFDLVSALLLGGSLLGLSLWLGFTRTLKNARTVFWFSNYYLALIFAAMVLDRVLR